jgi:hypothetical protein
MLPIWTAVKVINKDHSRFEQAGIVQAVNPAQPDNVGIKFDKDGVTETVKVVDLQVLN